MAAALSLVWNYGPKVPFWENRAVYTVILAALAGVVAQKYPAPKWPEAKSFRLLKGVDKW